MISAERLSELSLHAAVLATTWNERLPAEPYWRDLAECLRELEAARTRIAELERDAEFYRHCLINGFPKHLKVAPSSDQRWCAFANEKAFYGQTPEEAMQKAIDAAILRRLGGQTT